MTRFVRHRLFVGCVLLIASLIHVHAQDNERSWALSYNGSLMVRPVLTSGHLNGRGLGAFTLMGEYYLPKKWAAEAGYFRTEVYYDGHSRSMEGLQLGMKRYFVNPDFPVQPYVMAATQLNWGQHIEQSDFLRGDYFHSQYTRNPYVSFAPGAGAEIYLFSSIAFVAKYSFHMGIDSKTVIDGRQGNEMPYSMIDRGMYHNLELGIKVTFPFRFSGEDGRALFDLFSGILFSSLERDLYDY